jgi:hypothetical protein
MERILLFSPCQNEFRDRAYRLGIQVFAVFKFSRTPACSGLSFCLVQTHGPCLRFLLCQRARFQGVFDEREIK